MAKPMTKPPMKGMPMPTKGKATPKPPPPPMPQAKAPVPMGGVGPGAGAMGAMPQAQAPQGYAMGTNDTGGAGQPIQGLSNQAGFWNPNDAAEARKAAQAVQPVQPQEGFQGGVAALRAIGQRAGMARAKGDADVMPGSGGKVPVTGPDVSKGGSDFAKPPPAEIGATPGYDPQTGSYPLDGHFVAHLRAALGMGPKEQGFAGGTPNVGAVPFNQQADVGRGPLDGLLSGNLGPLHVGAAAANPYPQSPVSTQDQTPDPNDFTARAASQQIDTGADAMPQGQPGGSVPRRVVDYSRDAQQDPMIGSVIQTLMGVPQSFAVHDDGTVKKPPDPKMIDTAAKTSGATFEQTNAMMNPHHYTQDEFVNAIRGMPIALVEKLWNMQHYLNPQQQVEGAYSKQLQAGVDTAAQELQNARQTADTPAGKLKEFEAALANQQVEQARHRQVVTEGQGAYYQRQPQE